ncbi:MAG TPA: ABC transporter ATP-binding protein [bacterium]|nr:ABC transporter ATP-binding protein [bacterium]
MDCAVRIRGITKAFPRVVANDKVDLDIKQGEVHALVGENGAGKTTLMNILYGLVRPDAGEIALGSAALPVTQGFLGLDYGIGMIHQHFMLIGQFTVLENIILGSEPRRGLFLDKRAARMRVERLIAQYGAGIDLARRVDDLSVGEEQRVEILRVLYRDARIIVMDEPTAVLTPQEATQLFTTMKTLARSGRTVIFITHKLEEVMEVADTVTVMRGGRLIGTVPTSQTDIPSLAEMMVGRKLEVMRERKTAPSAEVVLEVHDVSLTSRKGQRLLAGVSIGVRKGEIFGICGVEGNGQDELFEVVIGLRQPDRGRVILRGRDVTETPTAERMRAGLAHIPPDRIRMGLITELSLKENLLLGRQGEPCFTGPVLLKRAAIGEEARRMVREFGIEPPDIEMKAALLSGGNQQKVVAARELGRNPEFLVASQPTRGLDIGAARLIHELLVRHAEQGKGVLLISADLGEVMSLADRIGVMYRGAIVGIVERAKATKEELGLMMAGAGVRAGGQR